MRNKMPNLLVIALIIVSCVAAWCLLTPHTVRTFVPGERPTVSTTSTLVTY